MSATLTVKTLIEVLRHLPPDLPVSVDGCCEIGYVKAADIVEADVPYEPIPSVCLRIGDS